MQILLVSSTNEFIYHLSEAKLVHVDNYYCRINRKLNVLVQDNRSRNKLCVPYSN